MGALPSRSKVTGAQPLGKCSAAPCARRLRTVYRNFSQRLEALPRVPRHRRSGRERIGHPRRKILIRCADSDLPEVRRLATAIDRWGTGIEALIHSGHGDAKGGAIGRRLRGPLRRLLRRLPFRLFPRNDIDHFADGLHSLRGKVHRAQGDTSHARVTKCAEQS